MNSRAVPRCLRLTRCKAHAAVSEPLGEPAAQSAKALAERAMCSALLIAMTLSSDQKAPEVTTEQLRLALAKKSALVLDARPRNQYAIAHIPGSINLEEKGVIRFTQSYPDRAASIIVYSNGPFCDWARQRAAELVSLGYTRVSRYQLGLPIWRALGQTAEASAHGLRHIFTNENNAVIIDARNRAEYMAGTIPGAESILPGEGRDAAKDRRLRFYDTNARIMVFADSVENARMVAEELARNAYSNSSYVSAKYEDLKRLKFFTPRKPSPSYLDSLPRRP
ncbi:MAG: rhodanese-like domain-containing protein [Betaproteobacteria bacterium]|nr:rhodanese-like domain-containing protein [Betaproteobacteria bacterium]